MSIVRCDASNFNLRRCRKDIGTCRLFCDARHFQSVLFLFRRERRDNSRYCQEFFRTRCFPALTVLPASSNASSGRSPINASKRFPTLPTPPTPPEFSVNTFVWSMEVTESGVNIIYSDGAGHMHGVQAKHAIVTVPPMVAARILKNLDNATKASMLGFRYGSYLVANCFFSKPVYDGSFSNWCSAPFTFSKHFNCY